MDRRAGPDDRYSFRRILGEGGGGRVWLVEDSLRPGALMALKELSNADAGDLRHTEELRREFAMLATLHHPNLVEVHEFGASETSGLPRFTLEFVQGRNIVDAVSVEGPGLLMELTAEALRALAFLHDFQWVHRDIKPDNLLVRDVPKLGCRLVLVDLGLSEPVTSRPTSGVKAKGTLPYMAPELFRNEGATPRSDLYALAAVMHEAVFGHPPFVLGDLDLGRFVELVLEGNRSRPPVAAGFPEGLVDWLFLLLSPDPAARPSSALEALTRLNDACGTRFEAETPASRGARLLSGPPAERQTSLNAIWAALDPADRPRLVWLCGGPGAGKTRVLRSVQAEAVMKGWNVFGPEPNAPIDLRAARAKAQLQPTVLLLDEVETASGSTIEILERVAREGAQPPLQVVAALRPGEVRQPALRKLIDDTGIVPTLRRVDLGPLESEGIRAMAARATGATPSDERVQWLLALSGGSPALAESLLIRGTWEREGGRMAPEGTSHTARLELLSPLAQRWLECLAVLPGGLSERVIAELAGLDATAARCAGEEAQAAGLASCSAGRWFVASPAIAQQLRARMQPAEKRQLHRAAALLVETEPGPIIDSWQRCLLWTEAREPSRAIPLAIRSAQEAAESGEPAEAGDRYAHALRLSGRERRPRHELRLKQADVLMRAGLHAKAARAYAAAARFAPTEEARTEPLAGQALALVHAGRFRRALTLAEEAGKIASATGDSARLAHARKVAGIALARMGREAEALPLLELSLEMVRGSRAEADVLQVLAACKLRLRRDDAETDFLRALEIYDAARHPGEGEEDLAHALKARIGLAVIRARQSRSSEAKDLLESVRRTAVSLGNLDLQETALSKLSAVALEEGQLDQAISLAEQAADLALHLGDRNLIVANQCRLADARIRAGQPGEAMALLRETLDGPLEQVEPENADYARMLLANAELATGSADEIRVGALLGETVARCRERRKARPSLVALSIEMERRARLECREPFEPVSQEFEAVLATCEEPVEPEIRIRALLARAAFHCARGNPESALPAADEAGNVASEHGALAFHARALALRSEVLERLGREQAGRDCLEEGSAVLLRAAGRIGDEKVRSTFLSRPDFAALKRHGSIATRREHGRLLAMYDMIRAVNSEEDPEALLESILDMALRVVKAERGMILLKDDRAPEDPAELSVRVVRNLEPETVRDAESYSRSVVASAGSGRALLALDAGSDERFRDLRSVSLYGIHSLMCVPLRSRGRIIGTVYLDTRKDGALFTPDDLRFLEAFADHAAIALENSHARVRLERQNRLLQAAAESSAGFASLVGRSGGMRRVFDLIRRVAGTDLPVLVLGESGTGKELVARAIHFNGSRRRRMFLSENCAAIPDSLLESELFGHVRGAFTGADRDRAGLFEQADGGSLFLDEVGDMSPAMQARLLRVLEEGRVRRVGGEKATQVNVRVIAATHRDLTTEVAAGRFREDLLYRLRVFAIELPPLRERPGDVALLTSHFLTRIARERGRETPVIDDDVLSLFERHRWPGNVRELQNTLQRLVLIAGRRALSGDVLRSDPDLRRIFVGPRGEVAPELSLKSGEKEQIRRALAACRGNRRKAALLLGVSRATLYRKLREHGL